MKKIGVTLLTLLCFYSSVLSADSADSSTQSFLALSQNRAEFLLLLQKSIEKSSIETFNQTPALAGSKSIGKAVLFSAAIPGAGQIYAGSYFKGVTFLLIEAATIVGQVHFQNRGNDLEAEFENFADLHWSEDVYWSWVFDECSADPGWTGSCNDISGDQSLRDYEEWRSDFSHFLPEQQGQQYYENVGKYNQFNIGWDDSISGGSEDSENREHYTLLRKDANDNFKRATTMATVTLFNHVLSALDAGLTVKRRNRKIMQTKIRLQGRLYNRELIPVVTLGVIW